MTIVRFSRQGEKPMEVEFPTEMDAFNFYADMKDGYREDDLVIEMENCDGYKSED